MGNVKTVIPLFSFSRKSWNDTSVLPGSRYRAVLIIKGGLDWNIDGKTLKMTNEQTRIEEVRRVGHARSGHPLSPNWNLYSLG